MTLVQGTIFRVTLTVHRHIYSDLYLQRKASQRITAVEGSRILEKFLKKSSLTETEEAAEEEEALLPNPEGECLLYSKNYTCNYR